MLYFEHFRRPALYQEIATGLTALAMTVVIVTRLRRFEQNAKLKFAYFPGLAHSLSTGGDEMRKRDIWIFLGAICLAVVASLHILLSNIMSTGSWGLSFRTEGLPPIGPASGAQLGRYDAAYLGDTTKKVLYLTFDAGYENGCTAKILDVLKKHEVPAAFFLVGNYIEKNADLVRRMVSEGHTVGNHTMHHYDMSKLRDKAAFQKELEDLENLYREAVGQPLPKFYRPPQGIYSEENLRLARELGYKTVFWNFI